MLTPLALRVMSRIRCLNRSSDFGDVRTSRKAEPEKLSFLRSCHALLASFTLSLSLCVMNARCSPSPADPHVRCNRKCYSGPHSEQSNVPGARTRGRVRRARGYLAVVKEDLLAEFPLRRRCGSNQQKSTRPPDGRALRGWSIIRTPVPPCWHHNFRNDIPILS